MGRKEVMPRIRNNGKIQKTGRGWGRPSRQRAEPEAENKQKVSWSIH